MRHLIPLIIVVAVFAALLVCHFSLLVSIWRSELSRAWKLAALFPLATPFAGFKTRAFFASMLWFALVSAYIWARVALP